jgi:hypothetical protein
MKQNVKLFGRISLTMLSVGVGLAITSWMLMWWVGSTELAGEGSLIAGDALLSLASLVALLIIIMAAPVVAGLIGIFEGLRESTPVRGIWIGLGCLMGAAVMIPLAAIVLGVGASAAGGGGGGGPGPLELVTITGLAGLASAFAGGLSSQMAAGG